MAFKNYSLWIIFFPRIAKSTLIEAALDSCYCTAPLLCEDFPKEDELGFLFSSGKSKKTSGQFSDTEVLHNTPSLKDLDKKKDTYTINFSNGLHHRVPQVCQQITI
jgi:hypothetical protein